MRDRGRASQYDGDSGTEARKDSLLYFLTLVITRS